MEITVRSCSNCGQIKSDAAFYRYKDRPSAKTQCKDCFRAKRRAYHLESYPSNREKIQAARKAAFDKNPSKWTAYERKRRYGLDEAAFEALKAQTGGACRVCGVVALQMCIDHDHKTNKVRGYLCGNCNRAIGMAKDNPAILRKMAEYLETTS